jgi:transposase
MSAALIVILVMDLPQHIRELIVEHHQAGYGSRAIGKMLCVSKSAVNNLLKRFENTGSIKSTRAGRCGRPRLLSERDERMIMRASVANPNFTARDLRICVGGSVAQVSLNTIKRALRRKGRFAYRPRKSPGLSSVMRAIRVKWCKKYSHRTEDQWRKVR